MSWLSDAVKGSFSKLKTRDLLNPVGAMQKAVLGTGTSLAQKAMNWPAVVGAGAKAIAPKVAPLVGRAVTGAAAIGGMGMIWDAVRGMWRKPNAADRLRAALDIAEHAPPMLQRRVFGTLMAHRRRGISATELRGFNKVVSLLHRVGMRPKHLGR